MLSSMNLLTVLICSLLAVSVRGQIPTESDCMTALDQVGVASLQTSLTPCVFGASASCCQSLEDLLGLQTDSEFAGCLCNEGVLDVIIEEIEGNSLAQSVGFNGDRLIEILSTCNTPFYGTPACPAPPQVEEPMMMPPMVEVEVETPGITVQPVETGPEAETEDIEEPSALRAGLMRHRQRFDRRELFRLRERRPDLTSRNEHRQILNKRTREIRNYELPHPDDSNTFERAHKKINVMLNNLRNTRDIITNTGLDSRDAIVDQKTSSPAWTDYEYAETSFLKNGDVVRLVPIVDVDRNAFDRSIPVRIDP